MNKIFNFLIMMLLIAHTFAQTPQQFNYQAVCRDNTGTIIDSQFVSIRISIHNLIPTGTVLYQEIHQVTTNAFGLVNIGIGAGSVVSGVFATIPWGAGAKYLEVEIDAGSGYSSTGTMQLLSVPYALYAEQSGTAGPAGPTGPAGMAGPAGTTGPTGPLTSGTSGQTLRHDGNTWVANDLIYNDGSSAGIGTNSPEAFLDIFSTVNGVLLTRLSAQERNAILSPSQSLLIFNTTSKCFETFIGTKWQRIFCGCYDTLPPTPLAGNHIASGNTIEWTWLPASHTLGYKWDTINDYQHAQDLGDTTSFTQTGLACNTPYDIYVWAYNACGHSEPAIFSDTTSYCPPCGGIAYFTDVRDGKLYDVVEIGPQCWMKQNLNYDQSSYGDDYCYDNDPGNCTTYGRLYTWAAVMQGAASSNNNPSGVQGVCPAGWHVPSDAEWVDLIDFLGGDTIAGGALKDTGNSYWYSPNNGATNSSEFTALPGGFKDFTGPFSSIQLHGYWWTATEQDGTSTWSYNIPYYSTEVLRISMPNQSGISVRCIKNP